MKIAIIGNCQVHGLRSCMQIMAPGCQVSAIHIGLHSTAPAEDADVICIQTEFQHLLAVGAVLAHLGSKRVVAWPTFYFPGYHPDLVYVRLPSGMAQSPIGDYQSSIVFYAWSKGLSMNETEALFCEPVYRHLKFFDYWNASKQALLEDMRSTGLSFDTAFENWTARGCFAHSVNHPKLYVLSTVAGVVLEQLGIAAKTRHPEDFIYDALSDSCIWPVYPAIADRLGIMGDYEFKVSLHLCTPEEPVRILNLREFIEGSLAHLNVYSRDDLSCDRVIEQEHLYRDIQDVAASAKRKGKNPYAKLPAHCFWRKAVSEPVWDRVDPVVRTKFKLGVTDRIATAGSCFAQHIARTLAENGYNYYVTETAPESMSADQATAGSYGLFSARYGNVYTARQLVQLIDRVYGRFMPVDAAWMRQDGRYVDPFRPQVEKEGFDSPMEVESSRKAHFVAVRTLLETTNVFVFTIGLTEAWRAKVDGAVFPVAPGVVAYDSHTEDYEFVNFTASEVRHDMRSAVSKLRSINPNIRIILTVSPVPLIATYEDRHVLVSTTYSKSALRVAADEISAEFDTVDYFPSYEIITGNFNRGSYYGDDLREVKPEGVAHVMRLFKKHFFLGETAPVGSVAAVPPVGGINDALRSEIARGAKVICDEELLERA